MRVLVAGSSGMVGIPLVAHLVDQGHQVTRLVRCEGNEGTEGVDADVELAQWQPGSGRLDPALLDGVDAVINLCGRNIGDSRWSAAVKDDLRSSRIDATRLLATTIAGIQRPPGVLINASATGYYGDRGEEVLRESSQPGESFLARLTRDWEAAALPVLDRGVRLVLPRLGMVLGSQGALARMLPIFRLGLGGPLGSGRQWWPWVSLDDVVGAISFVLARSEIQGPVNVVSPGEVRCAEMVRALGKALGLA